MLNNPITYLVLGIAVIFASFKSLKFINIFIVIKKYYSYLRKYKLIKLFVVLPILLSVALCLNNAMSKTFIDNLLIIITLLVSVFFSYIAYYSEYDYKSIKDQKEFSIKKKNVEECITIMNYNILASIILMLICLFNYPKDEVLQIEEYYKYIEYVINGFIYCLFIQTLLNLMIVLKRYSKLE